MVARIMTKKKKTGRKGKLLGVGLDLGRRRVRVARIERAAEAKMRLLGAAMADLPVEGVTRRNLKALFKHAGVRSAAAHCNLGPERAILHEVEFPPMEGAELDGAVRIEAQELIPDIGEMVLDYQVLASPNGAEPKPSDGKKVKVMVAAAPQRAVEDRAQMLDRSGLDARSVIPDGVAIANAFLALREESSALALDVSVAGANLVVVNRSQQLRAPIARFVQGGTALLGEEDPGRERNRLRERWLAEIERTLEFAATRFGVMPGKVLVLGDLAFLPKAIEWLALNLAKPVEVWNPLLDMERRGHAPDLATAAGTRRRARTAPPGSRGTPRDSGRWSRGGPAGADSRARRPRRWRRASWGTRDRRGSTPGGPGTAASRRGAPAPRGRTGSARGTAGATTVARSARTARPRRLPCGSGSGCPSPPGCGRTTVP